MVGKKGKRKSSRAQLYLDDKKATAAVFFYPEGSTEADELHAHWGRELQYGRKQPAISLSLELPCNREMVAEESTAPVRESPDRIVVADIP